MLVSLSSTTGAPGVSSWALALTLGWPSEQQRVLLEADLSGGVLAARYGLTIDPGVTSFVSELRRNPEVLPDLSEHGRTLADRAWCIPGPTSVQAAAPIWRAGAPLLAPKLAADRRLWLADCGRVHPRSPNRPLLDEAIAHLVFVTDDDASLMSLPPQIAWLSQLARVGLIVIGRGRRTGQEVSDFVGCDAAWCVDGGFDIAAIATRYGGGGRLSGRMWPGRWRRSAVTTIDAIAEWLTVPPSPVIDATPDIAQPESLGTSHGR